MPLQIPQALVEQLRSARRVTCLTGAGVSAESGVPTFRDAQTGLWAKFRPEELASPEAFRRHPRLVWEWYEERRNRVASIEPNAGHRALAAWEQCVTDFTLVTQNVDGLHQRAGSRRVIELHGNLQRIKCSRENVVLTEWPDSASVPPKCPRCGAGLRPDVVWFGEALPEDEYDRACEASRNCELFLSVGTSALVYPAAWLPFAALEREAVVVEINPQATDLSPRVHFALRETSAVGLPLLLEIVRSQ